jgi:hypothetical protein
MKPSARRGADAESAHERTARAGGTLIFYLGELLDRFGPEIVPSSSAA